MIKQTREIYEGANAKMLPPLALAGVILEGGIIDYNSNVLTGGTGFAVLGIGPYTQYMQDQVVISMRLVSVQTGEILTSVTIEKNLLSTKDGTTAVKFYGQNSGSIKLEWKDTERNRKPDTIECFVKPAYGGNFNIISGSGWEVNLIGSTDSKYGKVVFNYSGSISMSTSLLPIFNDSFFGIEVSRNSGSVSSSFELNVRQSEKERTIFQESVSASILNVSASWDGGNYIYIASGSTGFTGSLDEFRLWSTPLDKERFYEHVSFPEMINGNHTSSSTDDLFFRLDFEYPKNLAVSQSLINVDTNIYYPSIQLNP
jgi:hypothetical protein